jgi:glycosyltransferase involved in cell wall biosynthesis
MVHQDEILWSPANTGPVSISEQVLSLCDVSPLEHPEWFSAYFHLWYRVLLPSLVRRVRALITISEFSRGRIHHILGVDLDRIFVVPCGVNREQFKPAPSQRINALRLEIGLKKPFFLFVGFNNPRKNLPGLLRAWEIFQRSIKDYELVLVGGTSSNFANLGIRSLPAGVFRMGAVDDDILPALYTAAAALVIPSFYEGFGLPALEAMACGTPVIASSTSALPEVVGEAGILVDPFDAGSIAEGMRRAVLDSALRTFLQEAGFERCSNYPWQKSAEMAYQIIQAYA